MTRRSLADRVEGDGDPVVIAEIGVNHDGSVTTAHELVDVAAHAGADVVKFQTFTPELLASAGARTAAYQRRATGDDSQQRMIRALALPEGAWPELVDHCREVGVEFASTAFDRPSLDLIVEVGVSFLKVGSGEITNLPFLREIAEMGLPTIISTGMSNLPEVEAAMAATAAAPHVSLLHCVSSYPAPDEDLNIRAIGTLRERFGVPVGWSDHTVGVVSAMLAVAVGARILEKHITLDTARSGPDHAASADPTMFGSYVAAVRRTQRMLGDGVKLPRDAERDVMRVARRAWHAARDLAAGATLRPDDLVALRPADGIPPSEDLIGCRLVSNVAAGTPIRWHDLA